MLRDQAEPGEPVEQARLARGRARRRRRPRPRRGYRTVLRRSPTRYPLGFPPIKPAVAQQEPRCKPPIRRPRSARPSHAARRSGAPARRRGAAAVGARSGRSRRLALHLRLDRPAQGRDAEPRQSVARRDQRRALSRLTPGPHARRAAAGFDYGQNQLLSTWAAGGCAIAARLSPAARRGPRGRTS
jgi:hypothetical protein